MTALVSRLDAVLDAQEDQIELIPPQEQQPGQKMC